MKFNQPVLQMAFDIGDSLFGGSGGTNGHVTTMQTGMPQEREEFRSLPDDNRVPETRVDPSRMDPRQVTGPTPAVDRTPIPPPPMRIAREDIDALGRALRPAPPAAPPPTLEEFRRQTGYPQINEQLIDGLFGERATPQQRLQTLQRLIQETVEHTQRVAGMALTRQQQLMDEQIKGVRGDLTPVQEHIRQQHVELVATNVAKAYPTLEPYKAVIPQIIDWMKSQGYKPSSPDQTYRDVSAYCEQYIKTVQPQFSLVQQTQQSQQTQRGMPQMATQIGQTGHVGGAPSGSGKKAWDNVFE